MKVPAKSSVFRVGQRLAAAVLTLAGCGGSPEAMSEFAVRAYPSHFAAGAQTFADTESLAAAVAASGARSVEAADWSREAGESLADYWQRLAP